MGPEDDTAMGADTEVIFLSPEELSHIDKLSFRRTLVLVSSMIDANGLKSPVAMDTLRIDGSGNIRVDFEQDESKTYTPLSCAEANAMSFGGFAYRTVARAMYNERPLGTVSTFSIGQAMALYVEKVRNSGKASLLSYVHSIAMDIPHDPKPPSPSTGRVLECYCNDCVDIITET